jgi:hypothetical protein
VTARTFRRAPAETPRGRGVDAGILAWVAGLGVATLAVVRAVRVPITHDEAFSFLRFVAVPSAEAFAFRGTDAANNHVLLTVLDRVLVAALGPSELVLRLPVLAAFLAGLAAFWYVLRGRARPAIALAAFLVFALNRLGVELFSLSRGYGLAVGLALCGLALLVRSVEEDLRPRPAVAGLSLLALSALAQLTLLDVWAGASAALILVGAARSLGPAAAPAATRAGLRQAARLVLLPTLLCGGTVLPIALAMRSGGALYAGGRQGLVADTLGTLVRESLEPARWAPRFRGPLVAAAILGTAFVALVVLVLLARGGARGEGAAALFVGATYLFTLLAVVLQVRLLGVGYLVDRMAFSLVPLFALSVGLSAGWLLRRARPAARTAADAVAGLVAVGALVQLAATADLSRSRLWWFDADGPRVLEEIARRVAPHRPAAGSVSVGASWILEPGLNYTRVVRGMTWLRPIDRTGLGGLRDFYVVATTDAAEDEAKGLSGIAGFDGAGTLLAVAGPVRLQAGVPSLDADGATEPSLAELLPGGTAHVAWLPVVVRAGGLGGAAWRSDLKIANRTGAPVTALVETRWRGVLRQGGLEVPAGAELTVTDVAGQLGVEGAGSLEVRSAAALECSAAVYDATKRGGDAVAERAWLSAVRPGAGLAEGEVGRLEGLEESDRARTNVGVANLGPDVADVSLTFLDARGAIVGRVRRVLPPGAWLQEGRPFGALAPRARMVGAAAAVTVARGADVVAWATVIDSASNEVRAVAARR